MKIKDSKNNDFEDKIVIKKYNDQRLTFNFSFLTNDNKYNLVNCDKRIKSKLIEKIENLSQEDKVALLGRKRSMVKGYLAVIMVLYMRDFVS